MYKIFFTLLVLLYVKQVNSSLHQIKSENKIGIRNYTFLFDNEGWTIDGNQQNVDAIHIPHSLNKEMSRFIIGNDSILHVEPKNKNDKSLWYFRSPFLQNIDLSNYKYIKFSLSCFAGITTFLNSVDHYIRICSNRLKQCSKYMIMDKFNFTEKSTTFQVHLKKELWTNKYTHIIKFVDYIYILGDWTQWYETIGLDNVLFG